MEFTVKVLTFMSEFYQKQKEDKLTSFMSHISYYITLFYVISMCCIIRFPISF